MDTLMLHGKWQFRCTQDPLWHSATVPGSVLNDLLQNGMTEDPFYRENEYAARDLFEKNYEYQLDFEADAAFLQHERLTLICEGLDTLATVTLNGQVILQVDNMHRTWEADVKPYLKKGCNRIHVLFSSPLRFIREHYAAIPDNFVSTGCMPGNEHLRKAHYMFGWDWGPQLPDAGIWKPIYIKACDGAELWDVYPIQHHEEGKVTLEIQSAVAHLTKDSDAALAAFLTTPSGDTLSVTQKAEENTVLSLTVENPLLWWPNGLGEQPLYQLTVILTENGVQRNAIQKTLGLRTVTMSDGMDEHGREFAITVNGVKFFAMGANYIPEDNILSRVTRERTEKLIRSCKMANYNTLRVWGGGFYPSDDFYDLCDRYGIMVWQDCMFACNAYDFNAHFEENIKEELTDNIRRLRHHASLALWCGNNELESAWVGWSGFLKLPPKMKNDYVHQFEYVMPRLIKQLDPQTYFWPSSPSSFGNFDRTSDDQYGDVHDWSVWHGRRPFTDYRKHLYRFCSEFGFESFPCLKTVEAFTAEEDRNIFSPVMESHQKNGSANGIILYYLSDTYRYPKDFSSLLYVSQLLQAQAIQYGVEHWRRNRPVCMGATYWQVNDCWPVASWSSIDSFGRWKALHYAAKRFFSPCTASILDDGTVMGLYVLNEQRISQSYRIKAFVKDMQGHILWQNEKEGSLDPFTTACVVQQDFSDLIKGMERVTYFEYQLFLNRELLHSDVAFFVKPKQLNLPHSTLSCTVEERENAFLLHLNASCFAHRVELDLTEADAIFSDNYFSLTGEQRTVVLEKQNLSIPLTRQELEKQLTLRSLRDTY